MLKNASKLVALTVGAQAQSVRAQGDPIEQLIFGRFGRTEHGIGRLMDIADAHGHKLILFLDFCEYWLYGDALLDVGREISSRGHDLQIQVNADLLPGSFWAEHAIPKPPALNRFPLRAAQLLATRVCELAARVVGSPALAFRGGAFRFNPAVLDAFAQNGIQISSNYYAGAKYWPERLPHRGPFRWPNGVLELPVSTATIDGAFRYGIFENLAVDSPRTLATFLREVGHDHAGLGASTFVMHSWSLLERGRDGKFIGPDDSKVERFESFLTNLSTLGYQSTTCAQLAALARDTAILPTVSLETVFPPPPTGRSPTAPTKSRSARLPAQSTRRNTSPTVASSCPVCGATQISLSDFCGRSAVRCDRCGSLEHDRAFRSLCNAGFTGDWNLADKDLLLISPKDSDNRAIEAVARSVKALESLPAIGAHCHGNSCSELDIPAESFDGVIAHHVFAHVYDDRSAFAQVARLLRPGGRLFLSTPLTGSGKTQQFTEAEHKSSADTGSFATQKLATFRRYGKQDLLKLLTGWFRVVIRYPIDAATGEAIPIFECIPRGAVTDGNEGYP